MSRNSRLVVLATSVVAIVGAMAGTAGAVTWHVGGTGTFTGGAFPGGTLSATFNLVCPSASITGTYTAGFFTGNTYSGVTGRITYQGCNLAGQFTEVTCGFRLTATEQPLVTSLTTGNLDLTCGVTLSNGFKVCHIEGSVPATYADNGIANNTLTLGTSSNLRFTSAFPSCAAGMNDAAHMTGTTFTLSSVGGDGPHIVRTA